MRKKLITAVLPPVALVTALLLAGCASSSKEDDVKLAKDAEQIATQLVGDEARAMDGLEQAEAWLRGNERRELDAFVAKPDVPTVDKLRKILTAQHALDDLRVTCRAMRHLAARVAETSAELQASAKEDEDHHELVEDLLGLFLQVRAVHREQTVVLERWQKARTEARAALGAEAFGGKPATPSGK
jgi:hypothetical protein